MGKILWLASYPKSGNTWLRLFISNLLADSATPFDINRIGEVTLAEPGTAGFALFDQRPWQEWSDADIARLRPQVQERISQTREGVIPAKTHSAFVKVGGVPTINMAVTHGAVYVVRNPLDVVISYAHHQGIDIDAMIDIMATDMFRTPTNATNVYEVMGSWSQHVASWTASESPMVHVMRYEDMVADAGSAFSDLAAFMRVQTTPEKIERSVQHAAFDTARKMEAKTGFVERTPVQDHFFRSGRVAEWREVLSESQVQRIVEAHHQQMARFGYLPDGP
ncbi:MAG: sulfotransferase domain-containing protein [Pseudomonadota bacterium]